jgi:hypothetical protein
MAIEGPNQATKRTIYDVRNDINRQAAAKLRAKAGQSIDEAGKDVGQAGTDGVEAAAAVGLSIAAAVGATANVLEVGGDLAAAVVATGLGVAADAAGAACWVVEGGRTLGYEAEIASTDFWADQVDAANKLLYGDTSVKTYVWVEPSNGKLRPSEKVFGFADDAYDVALEAEAEAWHDAKEAVGYTLASGGFAAVAVYQVGSAAINLGEAAVDTGVAGVRELGAVTTLLGNIANNVKEDSIEAYAAVAKLAMEASEATANALKNPDQGKVHAGKANEFAGNLLELQKQYPSLKGLKIVE